MRWMMYRWWCEGGGDRAWWVIKSVFLRSPDKGFWACLGDLPPDMPRRPETWVALVHDGTSLIMCPTSENSSMCTHKLLVYRGGGPRLVVSTAAFHARVRSSVPGLGGLKETKMVLPHPCVKVSIVGSLHDREVACSASDRQGSNFESCVWRTVSSQSSHYPQEVLLAHFSLYVHKGGLKLDSFHFIFYLSIVYVKHLE